MRHDEQSLNRARQWEVDAPHHRQPAWLLPQRDQASKNGPAHLSPGLPPDGGGFLGSLLSTRGRPLPLSLGLPAAALADAEGGCRADGAWLPWPFGSRPLAASASSSSPSSSCSFSARWPSAKSPMRVSRSPKLRLPPLAGPSCGPVLEPHECARECRVDPPPSALLRRACMLRRVPKAVRLSVGIAASSKPPWWPGRAEPKSVSPTGSLARQVQKVDAAEDGEEAAQERDGVDGVGRVEAAEHDEGGAQCGGGEGDVVERVYSGWKIVSLSDEYWPTVTLTYLC